MVTQLDNQAGTVRRQLTCRLRRSLPFFRRSLEFSAQWEWADALAALPRFADAFFASLSQHLQAVAVPIKDLHSAQPLDNLRGRPRETFTQWQRPDRLRNDSEELAFAKLQIFPSVSPENPPEVAEVSLTTRFQKSNSGSLQYSVEAQDDGATSLSGLLSFMQTLRVVPAQLTGMRFGAERFATRLVSSSWGLAPLSVERFFVEADSELLLIEGNVLFPRGNRFAEHSQCFSAIVF